MEATPGKSDHRMNDFTVHSSPFKQEGEISWERVISKTGSLKEELERHKLYFLKKHSSIKLKSHLEERGKEPLFFFLIWFYTTVNFIATVGEFSFMNM